MILPVVKKQIPSDGFCAVPKKITYSFVGESAKFGGKALADFICETAYVKENAFVAFFLDNSLEARDEIYRVTVMTDQIKVGFRDARGAVNGAATVALLLRKKKIPCCEIIDYPDFGYRSFLLDFARGVPTKEEIFSTIRSMALAKYNRVHLHLIDAYGPCYQSDALPEYRFEDKGEPCSKELLREIANLCEKFAIEIIPEIEIPAHAKAITRAHPEFRCTAKDAHGWAICPGNDDVWDFYDKMVAEIAEIFPESEYLHIGTDELEFGDLGKEYHCYWDECPRCAALRYREGLADLRAEFYYVVGKMFEIVKAHGKKMMMWNDQIDISKDVPLSREILIHFWRIAAPGRGPVDGCTMEKFIEAGFRVVNSFYRYLYTDTNHYISSEKMKTWTPYRTPLETDVVSDQILGGEPCAWMFGEYEKYGFLGYVIPPVIAVAGDKMWDKTDRKHTKEYREALSEFLFGDGSFTCIFDAVGDLIPPRKMTLFVDPKAEMPSKTQVEDCLAKLKSVTDQNCLITAEKYIGLFEKILEQIENQ